MTNEQGTKGRECFEGCAVPDAIGGIGSGREDRRRYRKAKQQKEKGRSEVNPAQASESCCVGDVVESKRGWRVRRCSRKCGGRTGSGVVDVTGDG